jgi:hypothetical protein
VDQDQFELLENTFRSGGPEAVFDLLLRRAREQKDDRALFGAAIMRLRHQMGLRLIETEPVLDITGDQRTAYEDAFRDAARQAGELCLTRGDIAGAWPYFKALGEHAPVAAAIDNLTGGENLERVIEIAYQEGVNPRKGFELILQHHGLCSAITWFSANRDYPSRQANLGLLVRTLHHDVLAALKETIAANEGTAPETSSIAELITDRAWLFEGMSSYVDSTHLASVLRFTPELEDRDTLHLAREMADYGQHLSPMFHFRGEPPFEEIYRDHAIYLRAVLGEDVDAAIAHFRAKADGSEDTTAAEVLIELLVQLERYDEAIRIACECLPQATDVPLRCPSLVQLCQMAGDYAALGRVARERGDVLSFAASMIQNP